MNRSLKPRLAVIRVSVLFLTVGLGASARASPLNAVVSVGRLAGPPATGGGDSWGPILTPDGRFVLFASTANNVAQGSNGIYQPLVPPRMNVFLRDRADGTTILVSVNVSATGGGNGDSIPTAISTNGQYALFESFASNLVTNNDNNATDIFLRDTVNNQTFLVSVGTNGQSGNGASQSSTMTPDGRYIAFSSMASNLVPGDANGIADIFVRDMIAGNTTLVSPGAAGAATGRSDAPVITPDGRYVAFLSTATGIVSGATTDGDVYVRDLIALTTVSASASARAVSGTAFFFNHAISDDGQYVVFETGGTTKGKIFRYDFSSTTLDVVSSNALTALSEKMEFRNLDMTPDGRFVTYIASANSGTASSVYLWDGQSNTTTLVTALAAVSNSVCALPGISSNGQYVAYLSSSVELAPAKSGTNAPTHLYLWNAETGTNALVDSDPGGDVSFNTFMSRPCLTPDARFIAFDATDSNLGGDPQPSYYNVYLSDQTTNALEVVSSHQPNLTSASARALSIGSVYSVSSNGQYVAFSCVANRVVPGASNGFINIYVGDLLHGSNLVASVDTNGVADPDAPCVGPAISADGRYVAFTSRADNLVTNSITNFENVFVRDTQLGITTLASVTTNGAAANGDSFSPLLDASGRYVLFSSKASNLGRGDDGLVAYVYFRDLQAGTTLLVPGTNAWGMTPDGRYVAFGNQQICVWDSQSNSLVYSNKAVSVTGATISSDGNRLGYMDSAEVYGVDRAARSNWVIAAASPVTTNRTGLQFSGDGRYLVYVTSAAIADNDNNNAADVYRYDFEAGTNLLISQSGDGGIAGNGPSDWPAISWDGRFVAYRSFATNLVAGSASAFPQVYLFDGSSGVTMLASAGALTGAAGNNRSQSPAFSGDSTTLLFRTWASDLVTNDFSGSGGIDALSVAVNTPVFLTAIALGPGGVPVISWPVVSGINYQAQYKNDLSDPSWLPLPGGITVVGSTGSITDSTPSQQQRFYRVHSN